MFLLVQMMVCGMAAGSALFPVVSPDRVDDDRWIRELVYQAEVHDGHENSLWALNGELRNESDPSRRLRLVSAMGIIKFGMPRKLEAKRSRVPEFILHHPYALIRRDGLAFLLIEGQWLELGDWIGDFFLLEVDLQKIQLLNGEGVRQEISLPSGDLREFDSPSANGARFWAASLSDVLSFILRRENLSFFIPANLDKRVTGAYAMTDWWDLVGRLCRQSGVTLTRFRDNVVLRSGTQSLDQPKAVLSGFETKNQHLGSFLENLAETFGMELVLIDDSLADAVFDSHMTQQPWDEVLDCLAIMNGFSWDLLRERNGRPKLIIQKN